MDQHRCIECDHVPVTHPGDYCPDCEAALEWEDVYWEDQYRDDDDE